MSKIISDTIQGRSKDPNVNAGFTIAGVTTATGVINASSDVRISGNINAGISTFGAVTVTSISGNGAGLSNVGVDTATVDASTLQVSGISTFKNELKVTAGGIEVDGGGLDIAGVSTFASDVRVTGNLNAGITTATAYLGPRHENFVINGSMQVAQRGSTDLGNSDFVYGAVDRYKIRNSNGGTVTTTQSTTSPDGFGSSLKMDVTGADTSITGSETTYVCQFIEAQNLQDISYGTSSAKTLTVSFYVRSNKTGTYAFRVQNADNSYKQIGFNYTINVADTWERKTFTFTGDTAVASAIDNDNGTGLELYWVLAAGSTYTSGSVPTSHTAYANGDFAAGQTVNIMDNTSNEWYLTGVKLEISPTATAFVHRSITDEIALCQRYLFKNIGESGELGCNYGKAYSSSEMFAAVRFPTAMRATPTVTAYGNAGTSGTVHKLGSPDIAYTSIDRLDVYGGMRFNSSSAWATGDTDMYSFTFQADAEL